MVSRKEWTDEDVQTEIREAVRIVHEDRERATYRQLHEKYGQDNGGTPDPKDGKNPPPPKEEPTEPEKKKRRSLYWGDRLDES